MSGPGSVQALQLFNVSVTDRQSVDRLIDTFQLWRQTAQLQQVNLVAQYDTCSVKGICEDGLFLFYLEALHVKANKTRKQRVLFYTLSLSIRVWTLVSSAGLTGSDSFSTSSASSAFLIKVFNCSLKPSQARDSDYNKQPQGKHACYRILLISSVAFALLPAVFPAACEGRAPVSLDDS